MRISVINNLHYSVFNYIKLPNSFKINQHSIYDKKEKYLFFKYKELLLLLINYKKLLKDDILYINYALYSIFTIYSQKTVVHCYGSDVRGIEDFNYIKKFFIKFFLKRANIVFYSTPDLFNHIKNINRNCHLIPQPIPQEFFRNYPLIINKKLKVLFISRYHPTKGWDVLKSVVSELGDNTNFEIFCYKDENSEIYKSLVKLNKNIHFFDIQNYKEMPDFINEFDIVVGQVKLGVIGRSEVEALALGKPLISFINKSFYAQHDSPPIYNAKSCNQIVHLIDKIYVRDIIYNPEKGKKWAHKYFNHFSVSEKLLRILENNM